MGINLKNAVRTKSNRRSTSRMKKWIPLIWYLREKEGLPYRHICCVLLELKRVKVTRQCLSRYYRKFDFKFEDIELSEEEKALLDVDIEATYLIVQGAVGTRKTMAPKRSKLMRITDTLLLFRRSWEFTFEELRQLIKEKHRVTLTRQTISRFYYDTFERELPDPCDLLCRSPIGEYNDAEMQLCVS